ncbi:MAG TPA: caspase family protein [Nitrospira sp.]|nr:caspase family protein [Nitrospira sp.]
MMRSALVLMILLAVTGSAVSCKRALPPSDFVNDSLKGPQLAQTNYRLLKQGVVGTSTGFTLLWVPMSRPTESEARRDMVRRLRQEGIDLKGLPVSYANATRERGGFSLLGLIATPRITLTADIIEILEQPRIAGSPTEQPYVVTSVDVDDVSQSEAIPNKNRYAVVIGIERYRRDLPNVNFASHDAKVVREYLTKRLGFSEQNVVSLVNDHAAKSDMEKYLEYWIPEHVDNDSTVLIYFSGHGAPNLKTNEGYILPYDGDPTYLDGTGYSLKRLYETLEKSPAKEVIVMLDSCFSGTGGRSVMSKGLRPVVISVENPLLAGGKTVVLTASSGVQSSSTYNSKSHGLLTYFLLKGLQGSADQNNDGKIDLSEVYAYLRPQVEIVARQEFNNEQTPQLLGSPAMLNRAIMLIGWAP